MRSAAATFVHPTCQQHVPVRTRALLPCPTPICHSLCRNFLGKALLFVSPGTQRTDQFEKSCQVLKVYMPIWDLEELEQCQERLYRHISKELMLELYTRWGGVPRFVLQYALDEGQQAKLVHEQSFAFDGSIVFEGVQGNAGSVGIKPNVHYLPLGAKVPAIDSLALATGCICSKAPSPLNTVNILERVYGGERGSESYPPFIT
jgi:hypothetical protein